jgi:multiple sugar transport system substrate-binding protein
VTTRLRGTWDHPRGRDALVTSSAEIGREAGVRVDWVGGDSIGDNPDLVTVSAAAIGDAVAAGRLLRLDELLGEAALVERASDSAGPSDAGYRWDGSRWAVAVEAACMVGAVRPDLVDVGWLPRTWDGLGAFSDAIGRASVLIAAEPTSLFGTFVSLCQAVAPAAPRLPDGRPAWWTRAGIDEEVAVGALAMLHEVLAAVSPDSLRLDASAVYERMIRGQAVYCPLALGDVAYALIARPEPTLLFVPPPEPSRAAGTLAGGVGLGIAADTPHPRRAADFLLAITSLRTQSVILPRAGGQPARASAWLERAANARSGGFFQLTLPVQARSFLRPRFAGYPAFEAAAAGELHRLVRAETPASRIAATLTALWRTHVRVPPSVE